MNIMHPNINLVDKLENQFDFDFRLNENYISTVEEFEDKLMQPFLDGKRLFYRGEKKQSLTRPLLPSIFRDRDMLFDEGKKATLVDSNSLYNYYHRNKEYFSLYESIIGKVEIDKMYPFLAFSQHYFGSSPLIDFTKSLYVAMSFALKDRKIYDHDILIYTLELKNECDYTSSLDTANRWISDYSVVVFNNTATALELDKIKNIEEYKAILNKMSKRSFTDLTSPSSRLIDVPMNDLMRYQQGVFLLLDDFTLLGNSYLTKKVRDDFVITKWLISKEICPQLLKNLIAEKPYYAYKNITDLSKVVQELKSK